MIKALIIDDDPGIRATHKSLLEEYFPEICLMGEADSVEEAYLLIKEVNPQLILLDIEIKGGTGFQLLQKLKPYSFKVVFITGYNDYAIKAIKFHAIDYVLKPVNAVEFEQAVRGAVEMIEHSMKTQEYTELFLGNVQQHKQLQKIILRTTEALHLIDVDDILFAKSDNSYTTFYLQCGQKIMVSKGINFYEDILSEKDFFRPHQSYIVNLHHVKRLDKSDGGLIVLDSKHEVPVSIRRKKALVDYLERL